MRPTCATLLTATLLAPGCEPEAHIAPGFSPLCGDGVQVAGEVCLAHELVPSRGAPGQFARGDFDGDGRYEYYYNGDGGGSDLSFVGERDGAFVELGRWHLDDPEQEDWVYRCLVHDFDRDGRDDLFALLMDFVWQGDVAGQGPAGLLLLNRGWSAFESDIGFSYAVEPPPPFVKQVVSGIEAALGDFDGDGAMDVFVSQNPRSGDILVYDPGPPYVYNGLSHLQYDFTALGIDDSRGYDRALPTVADLDGDGFDDLVLTDDLGEVWVLRGDPELRLTPVQLAGQPVLSPRTDLVLIEDVDGDGEQDLVGISVDGGHNGPVKPSSVALALGEGDGRFTAATAFPARSEIAGRRSSWGVDPDLPGAVLLDLDGSGYPALIYTLRTEHRLVVHPHFGLRLGDGWFEFPLVGLPTGVFREPSEDGGVNLLVPVYDDHGTPDEWDDDEHYIDRWRLDP